MPPPACTCSWPSLDHRSADGDGGVGIAPPAEVTDGAGVDVALVRLQLWMISSARIFGAPDTVPAGKVA